MREKFEIIYRDDERFKKLAQIAVNTFDAVGAMMLSELTLWKMNPETPMS